MPSHTFTRSDRISAELRRLLGGMVHEAVRDNALPSVSVSDVEVTRDFDFATVYVTTLLPDRAVEGVKALNEMAKEFRRQLSEVTRDFDFATVYVTALLPDTAKEAVKSLNEMAKEFRRELSKTMRMRRVPELRFKYDDSVDRGERIDALLRGRAGNGESGTGNR